MIFCETILYCLVYLLCNCQVYCSSDQQSFTPFKELSVQRRTSNRTYVWKQRWFSNDIKHRNVKKFKSNHDKTRTFHAVHFIQRTFRAMKNQQFYTCVEATMILKWHKTEVYTTSKCQKIKKICMTKQELSVQLGGKKHILWQILANVWVIIRKM